MRQRQQLQVAVDELDGALLAQHVVADVLVAARVLAQLGDPVRVRQEPQVDHEVGVHRQAVLEAERDDADPGRLRDVLAEGPLEQQAQGRDGDRRGVDDEVRGVAQRAEQRALGGDTVDEPPVALERVAAAHLLEPADEHGVPPPRGTGAVACSRGASRSLSTDRRSALNARLRTSMTTAMRVMSPCARAPSSTIVAISSGGRLSTTNQPRSSRTFAAVLRPAPDSPLTSVTSVPCGCCDVHGKRLDAGDPNVPTCIECHSVHDIRAVKDGASPVHPLHIAETCAHCHADSQRMRTYGIPTNQFEEYKTSVHWTALMKSGDLAAPTCASCHGNHGASRPANGLDRGGLRKLSRIVCGAFRKKSASSRIPGAWR